jgi:hypothetical protein
VKIDAGQRCRQFGRVDQILLGDLPLAVFGQCQKIIVKVYPGLQPGVVAVAPLESRIG